MFPDLLATLRDIVDIYGSSLPVGVLIAVTCSLFGVFVILQRVVFIGITLAETAACGVAIGLLTGWHPLLVASLLAGIVVLSLSLPYERWRIPRDAVLGSLFVFTGSLSILLVSKSGFGLEKVQSLLYGNLMFSDRRDLMIMVGVMIPSLGLLLAGLRPAFYAFLDPDGAFTLGIRPGTVELVFFLTLGLVVAAASKVAGVTLVFCYLVVPPLTALLLFRRLGHVLWATTGFAVAATLLGIYGSYVGDLPPNQTISVIACLLLGGALAIKAILTFVLPHRDPSQALPHEKLETTGMREKTAP
jgi:ABC-type Mn2+/Zn2+ transport system permease subunit